MKSLEPAVLCDSVARVCWLFCFPHAESFLRPSWLKQFKAFCCGIALKGDSYHSWMVSWICLYPVSLQILERRQLERQESMEEG